MPPFEAVAPCDRTRDPVTPEGDRARLGRRVRPNPEDRRGFSGTMQTKKENNPEVCRLHQVYLRRLR